MGKFIKLVVFVLFIVIFIFTFGCNNNSNEISVDFIKENSKSINEYYYEEIINLNGQSISAYKSLIWVKNNHLKIETIAFSGNDNNKYGVIFDEDTGKVVRYIFPNENKETNLCIGSVGNFEGIRTQTFLRFINNIDPQASKIIGINKINQKECILIETNFTGLKTKIWIDKDLLIPIKVLNKNISIEYKNIKIGRETISKDEFRIPTNATIVQALVCRPLARFVT